MPKTILVIDDEEDLIKLVDYNLTKENYLVLSARDGEKGISIARQHMPELIILDVMLPGLDGWEVCKRLRADSKTARIPILMLTAKSEETDKVLGLELGADDYLTKPFSLRELLARVKALLRRYETSAEAADVIRMGTIVIDSGRRQVTVAGKKTELTPTEFNILKALADRKGRVMTRDDLITESRGEDIVIIDRNIDVHITSLRKKLGKCSEMLQTVRGVGYRLSEL
jgi:DNA-binding response OmpR family regulator